MEHYNRHMKSLFKGPHPSLLLFIKTVEEEARNQVQKVVNIKYGKDVTPFVRDVHTNEIPDEHHNFKEN